MKSKVIARSGEEILGVTLEEGDEVIETLEQYARDQRLHDYHFMANGAFRDVVLGYFFSGAQTWKKIPIHEPVAALFVSGEIILEDGFPKVHARAIVSKADGTTIGGQLLEAHVSTTLEMILSESPQYLQRRIDAA